MPQLVNGWPSPGSEASRPDARAAIHERLASRPPLELRLLHNVYTTPRDIFSLYSRLAEMPYLLDDPLRDPYTFGSVITSTITYLLGDPPCGIIWFPNLLPGFSSGVSGAIWSRDGAGRTREAMLALAAVAQVHNIHRFWSLTAAPNHAARKFNARLGLKEEGHLRSALCYRGVWVDAVVNGMLREEIR